MARVSLAGGRRPNVLVLMSDEQSWDTLGCTGNPAARTPHLDALAERATVFDGCYVPFPLCCPSRTSLWTGLMPRHHHVLGNWRGIAPSLADRGMAAEFSAAGYHTVYTGKWHVPGTTPARMGWQDTSAVPAVLDGKDRGRYIEDYRRYVTDQGYELVPDHIENLTPADLGSLADPAAPHRASAEIPEEHFLETWQTEQFLAALRRAPDDRPWLAACSFNAPHLPMVVPAPYDQLIDRTAVELPASFGSGWESLPAEVRNSKFAQKFTDLDEQGWREVIAHYLGLCALVDTQVGRILGHLRDTGDLANTIVVYTSDHGDLMGAHRLMEKGHLLHYEEALRVPLLVAHPDLGAARNANLVSMVDVAPTIAELAGVEWRDEHDGRSFAAMVGAAHAGPTRDYVTAETVLYDLESDNAHGEHRDPATWNARTDAINLSVRTPRYRYVFRSRDIDELFDHEHDPHEQVNLASDPSYAGTRNELRELVTKEVADVFADIPC
jgi:arylsulfatase